MNCPVCQTKNAPVVKSFLPKYLQCQNCSASFLKVIPRSVYTKAYFKQSDKKSLALTIAKPILEWLSNIGVQTVRDLTSKKSAKVLDYGCGAGKLVGLLNKNNISAVGFEPSEGAREITSREELPVYNFIKSGELYDLVMFWQSLEHIPKPFKVVTKIKKNISKNGHLLIAVPNAESFLAKLTKDKWFHYTYPMHVVHFTPKSIGIMLEKAGFKVKSIDYLSLEYTVSGLIQSFLNMFLPKDVLYSVVAHRRMTMSPAKSLFFAAVSLFALALFSLPLIIFYLSSLILKKTDAIVVIAQKG